MERTSSLVRDVGALVAAVFVVALSFGAISVSSGLSTLETAAMSVFVFAGGAQFLAVGIVGAGGSAVAAVLAGLLLNARHLAFGLAIGEVLGSRRLLGAHLMVDESVAFALSQSEPDLRRRAYWLSGASLFVAWNVGTLVGALGGSALGDPDTYGIDAAFPAGMLALLMPSLRSAVPLRVALVGAGVALLLTPFLPPGAPVLCALVALVLGRRSLS